LLIFAKMTDTLPIRYSCDTLFQQGGGGDGPSPSNALPADISTTTASAGQQITYSRSDHVHKITLPDLPVPQPSSSNPLDISTTTPSPGQPTTTTYSRSDHVHKIVLPSIPVHSTTLPSAISASGGAVGNSETYARADHQHPFAGGPGGDTLHGTIYVQKDVWIPDRDPSVTDARITRALNFKKLVTKDKSSDYIWLRVPQVNIFDNGTNHNVMLMARYKFTIIFPPRFEGDITNPHLNTTWHDHLISGASSFYIDLRFGEDGGLLYGNVTQISGPKIDDITDPDSEFKGMSVNLYHCYLCKKYIKTDQSTDYRFFIAIGDGNQTDYLPDIWGQTKNPNHYWQYILEEVYCSSGFVKDDPCPLPWIQVNNTNWIQDGDIYYKWEEFEADEADIIAEKDMYGGKLFTGSEELPNKYSESPEGSPHPSIPDIPTPSSTPSSELTEPGEV
jgi:hypothetical protein